MACLLIALAMPPLEVVPLANHLTAAAVAVTGVALVATDGLVARFGFAASAAGFWVGHCAAVK